MFLLFSLFTAISYFPLALVTVEISLKVQEQLADMDIDSPGLSPRLIDFGDVSVIRDFSLWTT